MPSQHGAMQWTGPFDIGRHALWKSRARCTHCEKRQLIEHECYLAAEAGCLAFDTGHAWGKSRARCLHWN